MSKYQMIYQELLHKIKTNEIFSLVFINSFDSLNFYISFF